jgi:hypothetical protein
MPQAPMHEMGTPGSSDTYRYLHVLLGNSFFKSHAVTVKNTPEAGRNISLNNKKN